MKIFTMHWHIPSIFTGAVKLRVFSEITNFTTETPTQTKPIFYNLITVYFMT